MATTLADEEEEKAGGRGETLELIERALLLAERSDLEARKFRVRVFGVDKRRRDEEGEEEGGSAAIAVL